MAERRMFAKSIVDSDIFLDMPISARLLYYDLCMRADDDGFVNSPKKIMRLTGASNDDMKLLITKQFVIPFESGIVVIKHWKIHNYIKNDRYKETIHIEEKKMLVTNKNKEYSVMEPNWNQNGTNLDTQVRLGKDRLDKDSIERDKSLFVEQVINYLNEKTGKRYSPTAEETIKKINARQREGFTYEDFVKVIDKKYDEWQGTKYEKYLRPSTLFSWKFENYLNDEKQHYNSQGLLNNKLSNTKINYDYEEEYTL